MASEPGARPGVVVRVVHARSQLLASCRGSGVAVLLQASVGDVALKKEWWTVVELFVRTHHSPSAAGPYPEILHFAGVESSIGPN